MKALPSGKWYSVVTNSNTYTKVVPINGDYRDFKLRCKVTDASSTQVTSTEKYVYYTGSIAKMNESENDISMDINYSPMEIETTPIENKIVNFPNPFNPTTKIEYSLKKDSRVKIVVYNMLGQEISTLVNGEKTAGTYYATFDASSLPSGMYYCKLISNNFNKTIKMLLTK